MSDGVIGQVVGRRVRAYFAPVDRVSGTTTVIDAAGWRGSIAMRRLRLG